MTTTLIEKRKQPEIPKPTLIDERLRVFLGRCLRNALENPADRHDGQRVANIRKALKKLQTEHYGVCEACRYPIDLGRLLTDPATKLCACCDSGTRCPGAHPALRD